MTKIAIFGLGKIAFDQHIPVITASKDFHLVATVSQSKSVAEIPAFRSLSELYQSDIDVDAVALCMPPQYRFDIASEAISYGYDLLLEKPPCSSVNECDRLIEAADKVGSVIFAAWHSKHAPMVEAARCWLEENRCETFQIIWKEDVLKWHPGQQWVTQKKGFGVFDPGINALSILYEILDEELFSRNIQFFKPVNWETPIATFFDLYAANGLTGNVEFDWRAAGTEIWEIRFVSGKNEMVLSSGGHAMHVNGEVFKPQARVRSEYESIYAHFSGLLLAKKSNFDRRPLQCVESLYKKADWEEVEAFAIAE